MTATSKFLPIASDDREYDVLKTRMPMSDVSMAVLRRDPNSFFEPLIVRLLVQNGNKLDRYREDSLRQEIPTDRQGFRCDFLLDPDDCASDMVGIMAGHFVLTAEGEFSVWIAMRPDRVVDLTPSEDFVFGPGLRQRDYGAFMRAFTRHPNHNVLLAAHYQYAMSLGMGTNFDEFFNWVNQMRQTKRNLLQAVMARARVPDAVENVLLELGVQLQRPGME